MYNLRRNNIVAVIGNPAKLQQLIGRVDLAGIGAVAH